ncbi:hypothetical protein, partial [uncultured Duncaniella sp.]|uniref:hypothetical protein n=1 Tax=uncultured Duncaniella sp. TaxID=2768039 RepID=UPI002648E316
IYPTPRFRIRALTFGRRSHPSARGGATNASLLRSFPVAVRIYPLDGLELPTLRSFPVAVRIFFMGDVTRGCGG